MGLALIAGGGDLPKEIMRACCQQGIPLFVIGFEGQTDLGIDNGATFPLGAIGKVVEALKNNAIEKIVFAGHFRRPSWSEMQLDWLGAKWLKTLGWRAFKGDDDLLTGILDLLQKEGFAIVKPSDILQNLMAPTGVLTHMSPTESDRLDIQRGVDVLAALSPVDVGQAVIVQQGLVLGIEGVEGTAELIKRCGILKRAGGGGVLVKLAKVQQNQSIDLPTIGMQTVQSIQAAGLRGIAISATSTQIIDQGAVVECANALGVFIVGISEY
ncbi:MAG: UDP-2,3-diacylglucosamine diphosphatase LpxI [Alphaproteobacteria bacterium]|nr:UDP-2,3-diacylglucosamine diphosphatase LpxI [Alphaproteobacteria bacterium]